MGRKRLLVALPAAAALCLGIQVPPALADPWSDAFGPRAVAMGESLRAAAMGAASTSLNPAGAALTRSYVLESSVGLRSEDKATAVHVSVCDSVTSRVAACLYYDYLYDLVSAGPADGDSRLHEVGVVTALPISDRIALGTTHRYVDYNEHPADGGEDASHNGYLLDAGLVARPAQFLNVALVGYNLLGTDDVRFPMGLGAGLAAFLGPKAVLTGDGRWNLLDDTGRYGAGAEYFFQASGGQQGFPIRAGYVYDSKNGGSYVTGGAGYVTPRLALDFAVRRQVDEGDERLILIGLRLFMPSP